MQFSAQRRWNVRNKKYNTFCFSFIHSPWTNESKFCQLFWGILPTPTTTRPQRHTHNCTPTTTHPQLHTLIYKPTHTYLHRHTNTHTHTHTHSSSSLLFHLSEKHLILLLLTLFASLFLRHKHTHLKTHTHSFASSCKF